MNCSPQALAIASSCFLQCMSAAQRDAAETLLSCLIAQGGGGGGGSQQVFVDDYSGVAPAITPTATNAVALDKGGSNNVWWWDGSTWGPPF